MGVFRLTNGRAKEARESVNLVQCALRECWPIAPEKKEAIVDEMMALIRDPLVPSITKAASAMVLVKMGISNLKALEMVAQSIQDNQPTMVNETVSQSELAEGVSRLLAHKKTKESMVG